MVTLSLRSRVFGPGRRARSGALTVAAWTLLLCSGCADEPGGPPRVSEDGPANAEVSYEFDPADKRELVASADNVFVGRVVGRAGQAGAPTSTRTVEIPQTQSTVRVVRNIKGYLRGTVTVNQYGGFVEVVRERGGRRRAERQITLWEGDPLLKPGEVVLLATAYNDARDWHTIVAQPYADRRIRSALEGRRLVREFTEAKRPRRSK